MHVEDHVSLAELKRLVRSERDAKLSKRFQIIVLAIEGYTAPAIAKSLGLLRRPCQQWVQRFTRRAWRASMTTGTWQTTATDA